ncbi:hypothetical protein [Sphingobium sp. YR657]|uniref:hypothetical protein n=1 Tax=Sphingobium sp. YR657 TaxID=1884366 RepID=UPI001114A8C5|nr:hypothetical protein [Sphingobium sp. YR657]
MVAQAEYTKQVVTFLDIMGFKEIVAGQDAQAITRMLNLIQKKAAAAGEDTAEATKIISFSDSVIRARPVSEDAVTALLFEVGELATAQWDLMGSGILVRGGITIGDVLVAPGRAFGPAFVRAYELEASWARSPRVVFDPAAVGQIRDQAKLGNYAARRKLILAVRKNLKLDQDGIWFIDYIANAYRRLEASEHRRQMMKHRKIIITSANELQPDSAVIAKYLWLIRYFNASAKSLHEGVTGLKISRADVPLSDELLIPTSSDADSRGGFPRR